MYTMTISKRQNRFIQRAMEMARQSPIMMRHGCVITRSGKIVAEGYNNHRSRLQAPSYLKNSMSSSKFSSFKHSFQGNCSCHAEMHAIHQLLQKNRRVEHGQCKLS